MHMSEALNRKIPAKQVDSELSDAPQGPSAHLTTAVQSAANSPSRPSCERPMFQHASSGDVVLPSSGARRQASASSDLLAESLPDGAPAHSGAVGSDECEASLRRVLEQVAEEVAHLADMSSRLQVLLRSASGEESCYLPSATQSDVDSEPQVISGNREDIDGEDVRADTRWSALADRRGEAPEQEPEPQPAEQQVTPAHSAGRAIKTWHNFQWEWERSNNMGWRKYPRGENSHIEKAWRSGASRVRLRSGAEGRTPMEIFFVDMIQQDPESGNRRRVRRHGRVEWWTQPLRSMRAMYRRLKKGEPRWESWEQYRRRQEHVLRASNSDELFGGNGIPSALNEFMPRTSDYFADQMRRFREAPVHYYCSMVAKSTLFWLFTNIATIAHATWIYSDTEKNPNVPLYDKPSVDVFFECFFSVLFLLEMLVFLMTFSPMSDCRKSFLFCFDAVCVAGSIISVFVVPALDYYSNQRIREWGPVYHMLINVRLVWASRVWRLFGTTSGAAPFFKGLLYGIRYALFIWGMLFAMLYIFAQALWLNARPTIVEEYFPGLSEAMLTLVTRGVVLDEVDSILVDMVREGDSFSFVVFALFVFLAHFNLLNMLIGAFCSVAGERAASEKEAEQMTYLHQNLVSILDCYIAEEGFIGKKEFQLIMKNPDFHTTLAQCGTDMEELPLLETLLFARRPEIDFETLFRAILHLRKGKHATVKDIVQLHHALAKNRTFMESRLGTRNMSSRGLPGRTDTRSFANVA